MATKKKDFTAADSTRYAGAIGALDVSNTKATTKTKATTNTKGTKNTTKTASTKTTTNTKLTNLSVNQKKGKRPYTRLDPRDEAPEEYRFTVRMPGEYGRFMNELAYQDRSTITAEFERLVAEEMERRPDVIKSLDELNK